MGAWPLTWTRDYSERYWTEQYRFDSVTQATHWLSCEVTLALLQRYYKHQLPGPLRVLDLGCGDGRLTRIFTEALESAGVVVEVVGCDLSFTALSRAKSQCSPGRSNFVRAGATQLPFEDGAFDGAVSFGYASVASYHTPTIQNELFRVIKSEGWLAVDFVNHLSVWYLVLRPHWVVRWITRRTGFVKPQYHFSIFGVGNYFRKFGFRLQHVKFTNCFSPFKRMVGPERLATWDRLTRKMKLERLFGRIFIAFFRRG